MQFYDQGHGNSNGFLPSYSQSPGMSSPNNNLPSQTPPFGYRGMENGMSRFMPEPFETQNFPQHANQYYQQQQNLRRNDANFNYKNQLGSQGYPNQQGNFVGNRENFSGSNFNSFAPSSMKGRMPSDSDMFASSAQNFSQGRQSFTNSVSRVSSCVFTITGKPREPSKGDHIVGRLTEIMDSFLFLHTYDRKKSVFIWFIAN